MKPLNRLLGPSGRPIHQKPNVFRPPPENKNFKADFTIKLPAKIKAPYMISVLGSIAPDVSSIIIAIQMKFKNGMVITGGPLKMEIKQDDKDNGNGSDPGSGDGDRGSTGSS